MRISHSSQRLGALGGSDVPLSTFNQMLINAYQAVINDQGIWTMDTEFINVNGMSRMYAMVLAGATLAGVSPAGVTDQWTAGYTGMAPLAVGSGQALQYVNDAQGALANGASQIISENSDANLISTAQSLAPQLFANATPAQQATIAAAQAAPSAGIVSGPIGITPGTPASPMPVMTAQPVNIMPTASLIPVAAPAIVPTGGTVTEPTMTPASTGLSLPLIAAGLAALYLIMKG